MQGGELSYEYTWMTLQLQQVELCKTILMWYAMCYTLLSVVRLGRG
jgi:hypothetical protein